MRVKDLIVYLEEIAPKRLEESYDNTGLILGEEEAELSKIVLCLDASVSALDYAIKHKAQLVLSHHPAIFNAIKNFTKNTIENTVLIKAIKNNIALYSYHTNYDSAKGGLTDALCRKFGVKNKMPIIPHFSSQGEYGAGRHGNIDSISNQDFIQLVKSNLSIDIIRFVGQIPSIVSKVAIYNGSYDNAILEELRNIHPDVLITGDLKYHDAQQLMAYDIFTIDAGHYATEIIFIEELASIIKDKFNKLEVLEYRGKDVFNYMQ